MKKFFGIFILAFILICTLTLAPKAQADAADPLKYLPVQDGGRTKPLETLARETLQLVYGRQTYKGPDGKARPALEIVMTWMLVPTYWDTQKIVEINHRGLKKSLDIDLEQKYFSPAEIFANHNTVLVMQLLAAYRETKKKLDPYNQAASRLESQLGTYNAFKQGAALRVVPPALKAAGAVDPAPPMMGSAAATASERWTAANELEGDLKEAFGGMAKAFVHSLPSDPGAQEAPKDMDAAKADLQAAVENFKAKARAVNPDVYPSDKQISIEVHYDNFHPFMWAWIMYLLAAILIGISWQSNRALLMKLGWASALIALGLHLYGFGLRIYLTGRPPVSNMYESVIWVSFGVVAFSMIFEALNKKKFILLAGSSIAVLCLIVGDLAPTILDQSIQPLQPVLRSNMWLTIHVLTITLSYSAYFLAWGLGNIGLFFVLRGEKPDRRSTARVFAFDLSRRSSWRRSSRGRHYFRRSLGRLFVGPFLGLGPERNLGVHCAHGLPRCFTRTPHGLAAELRYDGFLGHRVQPRVDGVVRRELRARSWTSRVRFRSGRS